MAGQHAQATVRDRLRGAITVENRQIDDAILVKSDGLALYHLAAMVDDHLMEITHVIRGAEWLPSLPLHAHIVRAFGWREPEFVHLSVFLKPSGKGKMSKRDAAALAKDGHSIYLKDLRDLGYTPEGVVNWVALMDGVSTTGPSSSRSSSWCAPSASSGSIRRRRRSTTRSSTTSTACTSAG